MKLSKNKTLLAVFAHPDDEAFTIAGTFYKYAKLNCKTILVTATLGQAGSSRHLKKGQSLAAIRQKELARCAKLLKIKKLYLLGYEDGKLHKADQLLFQKQIEEIIKKGKPQVVITFGPDGVSGHIDHVTVSKVTIAAFKKVGDSKHARLLYVAPVKRDDIKRPTGLPKKLRGTNSKRLVLHDIKDIDVAIDIRKFWKIKLSAFKCHFSQDDVRGFYRMVKKRPIYQECFKLAFGAKYKEKPASDLI